MKHCLLFVRSHPKWYRFFLSTRDKPPHSRPTPRDGDILDFYLHRDAKMLRWHRWSATIAEALKEHFDRSTILQREAVAEPGAHHKNDRQEKNLLHSKYEQTLLSETANGRSPQKNSKNASRRPFLVQADLNRMNRSIDEFCEIRFFVQNCQDKPLFYDIAYVV